MCSEHYKIFLTVQATVMGFVAINTSAQASSWSAHSEPSLFQSLGILVSGHEARSQILPSLTGKITGIQTPVLQVSSSLPTIKPTRQNLSVFSPSTDRVLDVGKMAGPSSAPPPSAIFMPQIAQDDGGADPILEAQIQQIETASKVSLEASIVVNTVMTAPVSAYWGDILGRYTCDDMGLTRFDYAELRNSTEDTKNLGKYINHMTAQKPSELARNDAIAYWANLYNALTIQVVTQNYPVKSIRKIKSGYRAGPWKRDLVMVEGRTLSLDDIEHSILRTTYQTPLVHYMVNCASIGCPNLKTTPWLGATLTADQEAAARAYINSPRGTKINNGRLQVSSIYKWFDEDFGGNQAGVLAHLRKYANIDLRTALDGRQKIDKYAYDWGVNTPK